jgi:hypothetical protein
MQMAGIMKPDIPRSPATFGTRTMSLQLWLAFVAATAVLLIIPGPSILTVISY